MILCPIHEVNHCHGHAPGHPCDVGADPVRMSRSKDAQARAFVSTVRDWGYQNPLNPFETVIDNQLGLELRDSFGKVYLQQIRAFQMQTGAGTRLMRRLADAADAAGVTLTLNAHPLQVAHKIPKKKLVEFYKRFGFTGRADNMVRKPQ